MHFILALLLFGVVSCGSSDSDETSENNECGVCEIGERSEPSDPLMFSDGGTSDIEFYRVCIGDSEGCGEWSILNSGCYELNSNTVESCEEDAEIPAQDECTTDGRLVTCEPIPSEECRGFVVYEAGSSESNAANCQ